MIRIIITIIIVVLCFKGGFSQELNSLETKPKYYYDVSKSLDISLVSLSILSAIVGQVRYNNMDAPRPDEFSKDDLLAWDRPFVGQYNSSANNWSDYLFAFSLAPLSLSIYDLVDDKISGREYATEWLMLSEALIIQSGLNLMVRSFRVWQRPFMYGSKGKESERASGQVSGSFYSGHASTAFTLASFFTTTFAQRRPEGKSKYIMAISSYTIATSIASLRVAGGKHFPSDVVVGAAIGGVIGWLVPYLHRKSNSDDDKIAGTTNKSFVFFPNGMYFNFNF